MVRAEKGHVGGLHRAVPFRGHDHQGMVQAEQNLGIGPVQVDGPLPRVYGQTVWEVLDGGSFQAGCRAGLSG